MPPETNKSHAGLIATVVLVVVIIFAALYFWNGQSAGAPTGGASDDTASIESELHSVELDGIGEDLELI